MPVKNGDITITLNIFCIDDDFVDYLGTLVFPYRVFGEVIDEHSTIGNSEAP